MRILCAKSVRCGFVMQSYFPPIIATVIELNYLKLNFTNKLAVNNKNHCYCFLKSKESNNRSLHKSVFCYSNKNNCRVWSKQKIWIPSINLLLFKVIFSITSTMAAIYNCNQKDETKNLNPTWSDFKYLTDFWKSVGFGFGTRHIPASKD